VPLYTRAIVDVEFFLSLVDTVGSLSMLPLEKGGVVDTQLKVGYSRVVIKGIVADVRLIVGIRHEEHKGCGLVNRPVAFCCPLAM
jgi:hypothetical protein